MNTPIYIPMTVSTDTASIPMTVSVNTVELPFSVGVAISTSTFADYEGPYEVIPQAENAVILQTIDKHMLDNVTVQKVPFYQTSNPYGDTVYIASEV